MKKIILLISLFLFSCEDSGIGPKYGCLDADSYNYDSTADIDDGSCIDYTHRWSNDIVPIFQACIGCHSELNENYSSIVQSGMIDDLNPGTNDMFRRINLDEMEDGYMPLGEPKLSADDIEKIRTWLLEGAPD